MRRLILMHGVLSFFFNTRHLGPHREFAGERRFRAHGGIRCFSEKSQAFIHVSSIYSRDGRSNRVSRGSKVTKTLANFQTKRGRDGVLSGAPVAFVLALLLAACQSAPSTKSPAENPETLMRVADDTRAGGDPATAVDLYRRVHELDPKNPEPLARMAATQVQIQDYQAAVETYRKAIEIAPDNLELHRGLGATLLSLDQLEQAVAELQATLAKKPEDARLLTALGVAHDLQGRHDLAQQEYRSALRSSPKNAALRNNYAMSLALSGYYKDAIAELRQIVDVPNAPPRYRLNLALVYGLSGDDQKAASSARAVLDDAAVRNNVAYYVMLRGMDDKSRAAAIMGRRVRGAPEAPQVADAPEAAPRAVVMAAALPAAPPPALPAHLHAKPVNDPDIAPPAPIKKPAKLAARPAPVETPAAEASAGSNSAPAESAPVQLAKAEPAPEPAPAAATAAEPMTAAAAEPMPAPSQSTPAAEPSAAPAPPAMAALEPPGDKSAKPAAGFAIQLGAFTNEANAKKLVEQLNGKGYDAAITHHRDRDGRDWYAVRAGGYASADEAETAARQMREKEQLPAVVVHLHARSQA